MPPEPSFEQTDKEKVDTFKATMFSASTVYTHYDAPKPRPKPPTRQKRELDFGQLEVLNALGKQQAATPIRNSRSQ